MSGFLGMFRQDSTEFDERLLERILNQLRFRGPDSQNIFVGHAATCFTLSRVSKDRQSTQQPAVLDQRFWILGDVRLDCRRELIDDLSKHGTTAEANVTDEELLLLAWRHWGEEALQRILGDFSLALWDAEKKTLVRTRLRGRQAIFLHVCSWNFCVQQYPRYLASHSGNLRVPR